MSLDAKDPAQALQPGPQDPAEAAGGAGEEEPIEGGAGKVGAVDMTAMFDSAKRRRPSAHALLRPVVCCRTTRGNLDFA